MKSALGTAVYPSSVVHSPSEHSNKGYLFIHITKTAGTSVAEALFEELPSHYSAWQYRVIFGRSWFNQAFKFCFVRKPWDRLYSAYSYLRGGGWDVRARAWYEEHLSGVEGFESFVMDWMTEERLSSHVHFRPQMSFICDHRGRVLVDHVGYFEELEADFESIAARLGRPATLNLSNTSMRADYRGAYTTPAMIERVRSLYHQDVTSLGYRFSGLAQRMTVVNHRTVPAMVPDLKCDAGA